MFSPRQVQTTVKKVPSIFAVVFHRSSSLRGVGWWIAGRPSKNRWTDAKSSARSPMICARLR
jgi:hypothetical protein